ncbi:flagellar FlbD family protein [Fusibacter ferrireducens]|uniref:Flagellar FlbD family protein n=1 Tax=Fusibacter ferrireducens TaxID=2785058 RepID=A0ABR9ZMN4_9FIRM|nr:flagellar FlbD family protein [Fusibacter ferrireducens]MBF4691732.1 flagellar FlbD family protein [Fusibacter ferrireducens]
MIKVTKLNGDFIYINSNLIEFIEEMPDTMVTLTTGKKIILKDSVEDIIDRIIEFNQKISK